jgi:hypothetical protein
MTVAGQTLADDLSVEGVQGCKESRGPVPFVVMGNSFCAATFQRKPRLGTVKSLNLAFLVYAQDKGMFGRAKIETYDILEFVNEMGITAKLETTEQMRL